MVNYDVLMKNTYGVGRFQRRLAFILIAVSIPGGIQVIANKRLISYHIQLRSQVLLLYAPYSCSSEPYVFNMHSFTR